MIARLLGEEEKKKVSRTLNFCMYAMTLARNAVLFIPAVILLNSIWQLDGVIAAQPVVETVLAIVCLVMYAKDSRIQNSASLAVMQ